MRCYEEHWLPYFASLGLEATALSLRGTIGSYPAVRKIKLANHVADVSAFLREVLSRRSIIVAHSFGGPVAMELVRQHQESVAAVALLCSVPPSGNAMLTWRTLRRSFRDAVLITRGFALKTAARNINDARRLFFSAEDPDDATLERYIGWFAENSKSSLDLSDFQRNLPARFANAAGRATFVNEGTVARLVVGAESDAIVDVKGVRETAVFMGVSEPVLLPGVPHDVMLGTRWKSGADEIVKWLEAAAMFSPRN